MIDENNQAYRSMTCLIRCSATPARLLGSRAVDHSQLPF
jgi:hypothetical protein